MLQCTQGELHGNPSQMIKKFAKFVIKDFRSMPTIIVVFACFCLIGIVDFAHATTVEVKGASALDGKEVHLAVGEKKGLVLLFLSTICPCSNSHNEEIKNLSQDFKSFQFVAINSNVNESAENAKKFFTALALPFPVIKDVNAELANKYKALKTPHAFVLLKDGTTAYQGGVSDSSEFQRAKVKYLRQALTELEEGQKVSQPEGRTLGCLILRSND